VSTCRHQFLQARTVRHAVMTGSTAKTKKSGALREARVALYRTHILAVAEALFADQGFANTRMQDIAQASEISLTTLYQLYPGKKELHRQLLISRDQEMLQRVTQAGPLAFGKSASLEPLLQLMALQVGYLLEHPDYLRMQLQNGVFWFHSTSRPSADEQQLWERGLALMQQMFSWGIQEGLFIADDPDDMGRLFLSLQQTRLANWVLAGMQEEHAAVVARIQDDFVRFFCSPKVAARHSKKSSAT
jgi:AcrR family transcriptional regulator